MPRRAEFIFYRGHNGPLAAEAEGEVSMPRRAEFIFYLSKQCQGYRQTSSFNAPKGWIYFLSRSPMLDLNVVVYSFNAPKGWIYFLSIEKLILSLVSERVSMPRRAEFIFYRSKHVYQYCKRENVSMPRRAEFIFYQRRMAMFLNVFIAFQCPEGLNLFSI